MPDRIIAGYVRESSGDTLNDAEREGQRIDIRRLAERDGYAAASIVWYDDWGYSGTRRDRPAYVRLRADISEGNVEVVYVRSVDRLGRVAGRHDVAARGAALKLRDRERRAPSA